MIFRTVYNVETGNSEQIGQEIYTDKDGNSVLFDIGEKIPKGYTKSTDELASDDTVVQDELVS